MLDELYAYDNELKTNSPEYLHFSISIFTITIFTNNNKEKKRKYLNGIFHKQMGVQKLLPESDNLYNWKCLKTVPAFCDGSEYSSRHCDS